MRMRIAVALSLGILCLPMLAETGFRKAHSLDSFHVNISGNFSYSVGGGKAHMTVQDIYNSGTATSGPLHLVLVMTPNGPFGQSTGYVFTAQYDLAPLAVGQHYTNVDSGQVNFTDPGNGCWYVEIVLYEQRNDGAYIADDWGQFSLRLSSGQGCMYSFTGNPTTISPGQSATLTWSTGGTSATLDHGIGVQAASGSIQVSPTVTTTYTCQATGTADSTPRSAQVTITVGQPAPTATFTATPASIAAGGTSQLSWTTTNATSVSIDNGVGAKPVSGTANVSPPGTTTYTLTATGPGGTITKTATVTVLQPPSVTFSASPATIKQGQSATLIWTTQNATNVSIDNGVGSQPLSGSISVSPTHSTTYTLTATGPGGTSTQQATVVVGTTPSVRLTATPATLNAGQTAMLSWVSVNATSASLNGVPGYPTNGSMTIEPLVTTTYVMVVTGPSGQGTSSVTVTVTGSLKRRGARH